MCKVLARPDIIYKDVFSLAIAVVGSCILQKNFNMKMCKYGSKEIQIVRDQIVLEELEKGHKEECIRGRP